MSTALEKSPNQQPRHAQAPEEKDAAQSSAQRQIYGDQADQCQAKQPISQSRAFPWKETQAQGLPLATAITDSPSMNSDNEIANK